MNIYEALMKFSKEIDKILKTVISEEAEIEYDNIIYNALMNYPMGEKVAQKRLDMALKHHGLTVKMGIITKSKVKQ